MTKSTSVPGKPSCKSLWITLASCLCILSAPLAGCTRSPGVQESNRGITFVAPLGSPPANSIAWAPAENELLVTADVVGLGKTQVYVIDLITHQKTLLMEADYGNAIVATWSPDQRQILVVAHEHTVGSGTAGLWLLDRQNKAESYLMDSGLAAWSPDGSKIASFMTRDINTASERVVLYIIDPRSKQATMIYQNSSMKRFSAPSWSPDGQQLAFSLGENEPGNLYLLGLADAAPRKLTESTRATGVTWSPSGNIIAYTNWPSKGTDTTLHLLSVDGKCDAEIPGLVNVWSPTWSPDGKRLGFIGRDGIYVADLAVLLGRDINKKLCSTN